MKPIEFYLSIAKEYFDIIDKIHYLFGDNAYCVID